MEWQLSLFTRKNLVVKKFVLNNDRILGMVYIMDGRQPVVKVFFRL